MKHWLLFVIATIGITITSCGSPAFMSDEKRWATDVVVLEAVRPYLADWAIASFSTTEGQRKALSNQLNVGILVGVNPKTLQDVPVHSVKISLEALGDWERGYLYIHEDVMLVETDKWEIRKIEDHLYLYNFTY